jgi:hypothetical protein
VAWIRADDHDAAVPLDDPAVVTHFFDACSNLHRLRPFVRFDAQHVLRWGVGELLDGAIPPDVPLLVAVRDTSSFEVVRGEFHLDSIARENSDVVHPHFSGDVGQYFVPVLQFNPEHCVGKGLRYGAFQHDRVFFWFCDGTSS